MIYSSKWTAGGSSRESEEPDTYQAAALQQDPDEAPAIYPEGGYWQLPPGCRLRMLHAVYHDCLATACIRYLLWSAEI